MRYQTAPRPVAQTANSHNSHTNAYNPPKSVEVYTLADVANSSIPADIREQFHHDEYGRVIFYTAPPLAVTDNKNLNHSLRYLADKARSKEADEKKRKARQADLEAQASEKIKRLKTDTENQKQQGLNARLSTMMKWCDEMEKGTDKLYEKMHGDDWKPARELDLARLAAAQKETFKRTKELEEFRKSRENKDNVKITGFKWT